MLDLSGNDDESVIQHLDNKIDNCIKQSLEMQGPTQYSLQDLNKKVNEEETLLEYIRDTEETFGLEEKAVNSISESELNNYIMYLDSLWAALS